MNKKVTIELPESTVLRAEQKASEEGFESLAAYVDALIRDDADIGLDQEWIRQRIEEGLASGSAGPLTADRLEALLSEGMARAKRGA